MEDYTEYAMLPQYVGAKSFFGNSTPLPLESGYAIVLGFGAFFSVFTTCLVYLDMTFNKTEHNSEYFNTAGRSVKTGLTASVIVSQWTWAATLLQSSNVAWNYGVSGPFWYAAGATIQVLLFGILAIELKRRARTAHTVCEMVKLRWGTPAHLTFLFFCFMANVIVTSMLLLGGAATVNALTGMDIDLAAFLIPWGVILYTAAGGLKATFLASYLHTAIIFVVLVVCVYTVYVKDLSTDLVYEGLQTTTSYTTDECKRIFWKKGEANSFWAPGKYACGAVKDNRDGSYLTMLSLGGLKFGIINIVGNFGTVFVDQSYWQSAIAAKPASAHKGYLLGGLVWFTIPFALATSLGLCALSLQLPITSKEASAGLVPPAVATHLFGKTGSVMMAIMLFMAITSTGSAEGIAVSSLFAYDIYKAYINPKATGRQILLVSKIVIVGFGLCMGFLSVALRHMKLDLGWVYMFMGNAIGSAVVPLWNLLMWKDANAIGAIVGAWVGMIAALSTWLIYARAQSGVISVFSLGQLEPNLAGNLVAICLSGIIHVVFSIVQPQNYDWKSMGEIEMLEDDKRGLDEQDFQEEFLMGARRWVQKWGWAFTITMVVIWPVLSIPAGVFSKGYFAMWVFISLAWSFVATFVIIALPIHESWDSIMGIILAILGRRKEPEETPQKVFVEEAPEPEPPKPEPKPVVEPVKEVPMMDI
jgi:SSS family transporter